MRARRNFLSLSSAAVAAAAFPSRMLAQRRGGDVYTNASLAPYAEGMMQPETFQNVLGETFTMYVENDGIAYLRLEQVCDFTTQTVALTPSTAGAGSDSGGRRTVVNGLKKKPLDHNGTNLVSFSLSFTLSGDAFDSGVYLVDHGRLGRFAMTVIAGAPGRASATFCLFVANSASEPGNSGELGIASKSGSMVKRSGLTSLRTQ